MLALLVALVLQDSAADLFKKVEEKYAEAKTLSLKSDIRIVVVKDGKEVERGKVSGTFRSRGDGEIHVETSISLDGKEASKATYVSDSRVLLMRLSGRAPEKKDHSLPLGLWMRRFCARIGLMASTGSAFGAVYRPDEIKLDKLFPVSGIEDGGKEKVGDVECRILAYSVAQAQAGAPPLKCRMWVDPAKLAVLKHEIVGDTATIRETHTDVVFDGELKDDEFKIP